MFGSNRPWWSGARFALAVALTAVGVPKLYVPALLFGFLLGRWVSIWWVIDLLLTGAVMLCLRGSRKSADLKFPVWQFAIGGTAWLVGVYARGYNYLGGDIPHWQLVAILITGSLWNFWLGWMTLWRHSVAKKLGVLALLIVLQLLAFLPFKIVDMSGDESFVIRWRWSNHAPSAPIAAVIREVDDGYPGTPHGADYPQFLGQHRDGRIESSDALSDDWQEHPPELLWRIPVGSASSSFALVGDQAITQEQQGDDEAITAYRLTTGKKLWEYKYPARLYVVASGEGPRATPTVMGDRVYAVGATGVLNVLERTTGQLVWSRPIRDDLAGTMQIHGVCASPLVVDDLVMVCPSGGAGPSVRAYRIADGSVVWEAGNKGPSYSSPVLYVQVETFVLHLDGEGLNAYRPGDGKLIWRHAWTNPGDNIPQPALNAGAANRILLSSHDAGGAELLQVFAESNGQLRTNKVWSSTHLKTKFSTPLVAGEFVYGLDNGILCCLDVKTGTLVWKKGRYKHGQLLLVNQRLIVLTEDGHLVLVEPSPEGLKELGEIVALEGKTWNPPAIKGDLLVVRNAAEAACFRLPKRQEAGDQAMRSETTLP